MLFAFNIDNYDVTIFQIKFMFQVYFVKIS